MHRQSSETRHPVIMTGIISKEGTRTKWNSKGLSLDRYCFLFFTVIIYLHVTFKFAKKCLKGNQQCLLLVELVN